MTFKEEIIDGLSPSKSSRELKKNYMTMPLKIIDRITDGLSPQKSSKELEKNYMTLPLIITDEITNKIKLIGEFWVVLENFKF